MAVAALIRFVQGPNSDTAGRAVKGTLTDGAVTVSNGNNTNVVTWKYEVLYVPPGSALSLTTQGPGSTATFSFTPDVAGTYRLRLTVQGASSADVDQDIRCFCVAFTNGYIAPPYQRNPDPLPLTGTGSKPDEMNLGGQLFGWGGDTNVNRKLLHQFIKNAVASPGDVTGPSSSTGTAIPRYSGTSGKVLLNSGVTIDGSNNITTAGSISASNVSGTNTGDQTITLSGDVTGSGTSAIAATIPNNTVTYAKMQNVSAASKLLGRGSSSAGDPQEISLGAGLDMSGTTVSVTPSTFTLPFVFDYSGDTTTNFPVEFRHSNVFPSAPGGYGKGAFRIRSTGIDNAQPIFYVQFAASNSSIGNVGVVFENTGGNATNTDVFACALELLAHNSSAGMNAYNGKWELGPESGQTGGTNRYKDGRFYLGYRRGPEHPSGENTGFAKMAYFLPNTSIGLGRMELLGKGIRVETEFAHANEASELRYIHAHGPVYWIAETTDGTSPATIDAYGYADTFVRSRSKAGRALGMVQADAGEARLEVRSNYASGTSNATLGLYLDASSNGHDIVAQQSGGDLLIRSRTGGVLKETAAVDAQSDGLFVFYRWSDIQKGRIRLGNGGGSAGGGIIAYDSSTGVLDISGTNNRLTFGSGGILNPERQVVVTSPTEGGSTVIAGPTTQLILLNGALTAYGLELPTAPPAGSMVRIFVANTIGTLTLTVGTGTVVNGVLSSVTANSWITCVYRASGSGIWYVGT